MSQNYNHNQQQQQGEIVKVEGGHIILSTGKKDRHSKVCTSKGPRDRRVRLSAHTAIKFYDVQDRLGFDRPSKAVDWLIKKAKTAIDKLAELPPWKPTDIDNNNNMSRMSNPNASLKVDQKIQNPDEFSGFEQYPDGRIGFNPMGCYKNLSFDNQSQDLKLSLEVQESNCDSSSNNNFNNNNVYFDGSGSGSGSGWPENQVGGFVFSAQAQANTTPFVQPLLGQTITNELLLDNSSRREPLQSSSVPSFRAWVDPLPQFVIDQHPAVGLHYSNGGFGGFSGFGVPARIRGEQEECDGVSDRPSSVSSDSHH